MPNYDYRCSACGATRELHRSVAERDNVVMCLHCTRAMERQPAAPGFALVGAGFYRNDYATPRPKGQSE